MNKKYKAVIALLMTLLMVLGSFSMALAIPKDGGGSTGTSVHLKNNSGEGITSVVVYFGESFLPLALSGNNWENSDSGNRVLDEITKVVVTFENSDVNTYIYPDDFGPRGHGVKEPIEYSDEGKGSGSINLWLNSVINNLKPAIQLEKSVTPDVVNSKEADVEYSFKVTNTGDANLVYVIMDDTKLGVSIDIGNLAAGEEYTTNVAVNLGDFSNGWDENEFKNTATVEGMFRDTKVTDEDSATVTFTESAITPGGIKIIKNVPNIDDSNVPFIFRVYDRQENEVASDSASEVSSLSNEPLVFSNLAPGTYYVSEDTDENYDTEDISQRVTVESGKTAEVTFVNTLITEKPSPGAIEVFKNVPNVTDSAVKFDVTVYDSNDDFVTSGSISEQNSWLIEGLEPGNYVVEEDSAVGYNTTDDAINVTIKSGETARVTLVNTLINSPDTTDAAIQVIKTVDPKTVSSKTASVTYTFEITNVGDYDFYEVMLSDLPIGVYSDIGSLAAGATTTTSITFDLSLLGTSTYGNWDGDIFNNTATVKGYYDEEKWVTDDDDATVTYSSDEGGGGGGGGHRHTTTTTVVEEPTPAAPVVEEPIIEEPIIEEPTPAGPLPQTGGIPALLFFGVGSLIAGGGALLRRKEK